MSRVLVIAVNGNAETGLVIRVMPVWSADEMRPRTFSPAARRRARERAVQFLFGLDFTQYSWQDALGPFWEAHPARVGVRLYAEQLIQGVIESRASLDGAIAAALDNWTLDRVARVERNVLRVALYEMRYVEDVPETVAINEAIEVARTYGADDAPRFVNGVLDRLRTAQIEG